MKPEMITDLRDLHAAATRAQELQDTRRGLARAGNANSDNMTHAMEADLNSEIRAADTAEEEALDEMLDECRNVPLILELCEAAQREIARRSTPAEATPRHPAAAYSILND